MRASIIQDLTKEPEPADAFAMMIDGALWLYIDEKDLFLRMKDKTAVPKAFQVPADEDAIGFLANANAHRAKTPPLPVQRGDSTTIGSFTVDERIMGMVEDQHGDVDWFIWGQEWFIARDRAGLLAAVWKMPDGSGALEVFLAEYKGRIWGCNKNLAMTMALPKDPEAVATMRREAKRTDAKTVAVLARNIAIVEKGTPAQLIEVDGSASVGPRKIPLAQVKLIRALAHGADLQWLYAGPREPVGAKVNGTVVAIVMPLEPPVVENAPGGST